MKLKIKKLLADYLGCNVRCVKDSYYDEEVVSFLNREYLVISKEESLKRVKEFLCQMIDEEGLRLFEEDIQKWVLNNALNRENYFDEIVEHIVRNYVYFLSFSEVLDELKSFNEITEEEKESIEEQSWYSIDRNWYLNKLINQLLKDKNHIVDNFSYYDSSNAIMHRVPLVELNLEKIFKKIVLTYPLANFLSSDKREIVLKDKLGHEWFVYKQN